jgi:hypothetical protein
MMNAPRPPHLGSIDTAFARALERDRHRAAVDEAKKRAAEQRCDYEAFRQLVLGANLRPMEKSRTARTAPLRTRKFDDTLDHGVRTLNIACDRRHARPPEVNFGGSLTASAPCAARTADEFARAWRRTCGDDDALKTQFLFDFPLDAFETVFEVEIGLDALRDFVRLIRARVEVDETCVERAVSILCALTRCGRFRTHARLAGIATATAALETFRLAHSSEAVERAREAWRVE